MKFAQFSQQAIRQRILFENPWWEAGVIDNYYNQMYRRIYFDVFKPLVTDLHDPRVLVLIGPRRVGKTIMLYHAVQELIDSGIDAHRICYLSMETPLLSGLDLDEIVSHAHSLMHDKDCTERCYFILDGIRYVRSWEDQVRKLAEQFKQIKFIVAGSAVSVEKMGNNQPADKRFVEFILPILSFHEYMELKDYENLISYTDEGQDLEDAEILNKHFVDYINFGGLPEIIHYEKTEADPERYIKKELVNSILMSNLHSFFEINNVSHLNTFFSVLAYKTGDETSTGELESITGLTSQAIKKYLIYLEAVQMIKTVSRIGPDGVPHQKASHFKIYITNPALRAAIFAPTSLNDERISKLAETAIFCQWQHTGNTPLYYFLLNSGQTCFVRLDSDDKPKWITCFSWMSEEAERSPMLNELKVFCSKHKLSFPLITTFDHQGAVHDSGIMYTFEPASSYSYSIGRFIVESRMELHTL